MPNDDYSKLLDPATILELLPQKIKERERLINSLVIDLQVYQEAEVPEVDIKTVVEGIKYNRRIVEILKSRLDSVQKAVNGTT